MILLAVFVFVWRRMGVSAILSQNENNRNCSGLRTQQTHAGQNGLWHGHMNNHIFETKNQFIGLRFECRTFLRFVPNHGKVELLGKSFNNPLYVYALVMIIGEMLFRISIYGNLNDA